MRAANYLLVLDADMELCPEFLPAAIDALQADPLLAGVGNVLIEMSAGLEFRERQRRQHPDDLPGEVGRLAGAVLYRMSAFGQDGYFMDRNLHCAEEFDAGLRLRARGWRLRVLPVATVRRYGHTGSSFRLLRHRWRTRGFDGYGELLRASWARDRSRSVTAGWVRVCRFQLLTLLWWLLCAGLLAAAATGAAGHGALLLVAALPFAALLARKRSVVKAAYALCQWQVSAAALVRGLCRRRVPPALPLACVVLQEPA